MPGLTPIWSRLCEQAETLQGHESKLDGHFDQITRDGMVSLEEYRLHKELLAQQRLGLAVLVQRACEARAFVLAVKHYLDVGRFGRDIEREYPAADRPPAA